MQMNGETITFPLVASGTGQDKLNPKQNKYDYCVTSVVWHQCQFTSVNWVTYDEPLIQVL